MNSHPQAARRIVKLAGLKGSVVETDVSVVDAVVVPHGSDAQTIRLVPGGGRARFDDRDSILIRNEGSNVIYVLWRDGSSENALHPLGPGRWHFSRFVDQKPDLVGWWVLAQGMTYWAP